MCSCCLIVKQLKSSVTIAARSTPQTHLLHLSFAPSVRVCVRVCEPS